MKKVFNFIMFLIIVTLSSILIIQNNKSNEYRGKTLCILGDSISTFGEMIDENTGEKISSGKYTYGGNYCRYPQEDLFTDVKYMYWYKLLDTYDMKLGVNESFRSTYVTWQDNVESWNEGEDKHIASMTRIKHLGENGEPDVIIVHAGTNDIGRGVDIGVFNPVDPTNYTYDEILNLQVDTFANAYRTMIIRLQYLYPNAKIICCIPNFIIDNYSTDQLNEYSEIINTICDYYGVVVVDLRKSGITTFNASNYLPDGVHPNKKGMDLIYKHITKEF